MKSTSEKKTKKSHVGTVSAIIASIVCIFIGLLLGLIFLVAINPAKAWSDGFSKMILAGFRLVNNANLKAAGSNWKTIGQEIVQAAPIIMTGLSVTFAFKMGLFNIGAAGQYTVGAFGALYFALVLKMPWYVCLLAATLFGAVWGAIPGFFKAYFNINEVISAIMFNWIGLYMVNTLIYQNGSGPMYNSDQAKTYTIESVNISSKIPSTIFGINLSEVFAYNSMTIAIFLAIIIAVIVYIVLNKTTFGYELMACGHNRDAARYAGINDKKNIIISMIIAGALAGFGAGLYYLSGAAQWNPQNSTALPAAGFDGISVALLAMLNPIGCIFSGLFISHLSTGGAQMTQSIFPMEISNVISGIIIYLCAFSSVIQTKVTGIITRKNKKNEKEAG